MIRLLQLIIWGHVHEWSEPDMTGPVYRQGYNRPIDYFRDCRCKKCGEWRRFRL